MTKLAFEIKRKLFHITMLIHLFIYFIIIDKTNSKILALLYLFTVLVGLLVMEYFRIIKKKKILLFQKLWRKKEVTKLGGEVYYILGMIITLIFFDFKIAIAAILMMGIGDAAATIIGVKYGKHKFLENSSVQGSTVELIINLIIGYLILQNWVIIIAMATTAMLVETFSEKINDNLAIPILAGLVGQILINLFLY